MKVFNCRHDEEEMILNEMRIFEILSDLRVIGDPEYGGTGSIKEYILVGCIYGFFTESERTVTRVDREDMKVIKSGTYSYIIWLDEPLDDLEKEDEDMQDEGIDPEKTETEDIVLMPVAIEGPYTDKEIMELIHEGAI